MLDRFHISEPCLFQKKIHAKHHAFRMWAGGGMERSADRIIDIGTQPKTLTSVKVCNIALLNLVYFKRKFMRSIMHSECGLGGDGEKRGLEHRHRLTTENAHLVGVTCPLQIAHRMEKEDGIDGARTALPDQTRFIHVEAADPLDDQAPRAQRINQPAPHSGGYPPRLQI
jgi:hypothetical protein